MKGQRSRKSQSAMEYLMTYGWAILIIAVVLGALFQLGVFNAGTFAPRAPPGACQVFRPNGPMTSSLINLEGVCSGELPQYVNVFSGNAGSFVGVGEHQSLQLNTYFTLSAWVNLNGQTQTGGAWESVVDEGANAGGDGYGLVVYTSGAPPYAIACFAHVTADNYFHGSLTVPSSGWTFLTCTFTGSNLNGYVNSNLDPASLSLSGSQSTGNYNFNMGADSSGNERFTGEIANIQLYNTSLSANEILYLYDEGIGGAPIKLQNLVGWWPLNGNANDYSGNNNNGAPAGVTYTNQWASGYTPP